MKIRSPKTSDLKFKLTLTHKELKVIENALNYSDDHHLIINENLFDCDEFKSEQEFEEFEDVIWLKIIETLNEINVY